DLYGSIEGFIPFPSKKHNLVVIILVLTLLFLISFFALVIFILCRQYRAKVLKHDPSPTKNGNLFCIWNFDGKIAFEDIIRATEDFDIKYCIGTGGYGNVYKAVLPSGKGSLFCALSIDDEAVEMDWTKRVNIVKGVAHALSYMYHDCNPPIAH
ncbi:hypothetical protein Golob_025041, partial [Gossypium lobatum]|nr:hypothetical protein [Gossypium lobatum]